jgi:phosphatidylserine/phosphatidylglycerophosphate/cardiolipin synthase-like enzyme
MEIALKKYAFLIFILMATAFAMRSSAATNLLFSPEDNLQQVWVSHIEHARVIHIACFGISNRAIASALETALKERHARVVILEDRRQSALRSDLHDVIASAGAQIIIKHSSVLLHDKMAVFDPGLPDECAIVGSYNLSQSAEEQDNSDVVFDDDSVHSNAVEKAWELMFRRETHQGSSLNEPVAITRSVNTNDHPGDPMVWVNYSGSRWYGKTRDGEYIKESIAKQKGYRPSPRE